MLIYIFKSIYFVTQINLIINNDFYLGLPDDNKNIFFAKAELE
jgi:hypothetical protein